MLPSELKQLLEKGEEVRIIDVREKEEVDRDGPLVFEGKDEQGTEKFKVTAEHIPMGKLFTKAAKGELSKSERIVTVCKVGRRCKVAAKDLRDQDGYYMDHLEGGMDAWNND